MSSKDYVREPKTKFDYSPQSCLPYLQDALIEFRDDYPDWYMFITENKLVHYGTGKYIVADEEDIASVEAAPVAQSAVIATPKKRTASRAAGTPIRLFTKEQSDLYMRSAPMVAKVDRDIAAFILRAVTSVGARNELFAECGHNGRYMLIFIEKRGKGAEYNPLQILASIKLHQRRLLGVTEPNSAGWTAFHQDLAHYAVGAGGVTDAEMKSHLITGLYRLPRDIRIATIDAATTATTSREVITKVSSLLDQDHLAGLISSNFINMGHPAPAVALPPPPAPEPPYPNPTMSLAVDQVTTNSPIPALAAGYHRDPSKSRASMPEGGWSERSQQTPRWVAAEHGPCLNWTRGRDGCDGRHHLKQCPLPRQATTAAAVTAAEYYDADPEPPQPYRPALTVKLAQAPAARDFAELFMGNSPLQAVLKVDMIHDHESSADFIMEPDTIADIIDVTDELDLPYYHTYDPRGLPDDFPECGVE